MRVLDCRPIPAGERRAAALSLFDTLAPGEVMLVEAGEDLRGLLGAFQAERKGQFEWSPLAEGPKVWRIEVARREAAAGALRRVSEALAWDHDRLDGLEREAFERRSSGDLTGARETFAVFAHGLRRHIRFEEEILFPEFEARSGIPSQAGPTAVMRAEHQEIQSLIVAMAEAVADPASPVERLRADLHRVLGDHNTKEENVLYPGADRIMSDAEGDDLVRRIQSC